MVTPTVGLWLGMLATFGVLNQVPSVAIFSIGGLVTSIFLSRSFRQIFVTLGLCAALGVLLVIVRHSAILNHDVKAVIGQRVSSQISFRITEDPRLQASRGFGAMGFEKEIAVGVDVYRVGDIEIGFPVYLSSPLFDGALTTAELSSEWTCRGRLREVTGIRRAIAYASCLDPPVQLSLASNQQHIASVVRDGLQRMTSGRHVGDDGAALLPGLVVGDTSAQSPELENSLQAAGLGHLTAVSGANVAIVIAAFEVLLRRTRIRREVRLVLLAFAVVAFVVIARPSPSVVRAAAMALFTLWVWFRGDQRYSEIILFSSCLALLIIDPWLAASWGFGLSVAATLGLIMLPRLWGVTNQSSLLVRAVATAVAAGLATLPLLIAMGSNPTLASLPANVFAEFFVAPATIAGVVSALLAAFESIPLIGAMIAPLTNLLAAVIADFGICCARGIVLIANTANQSIFNVVVTSSSGIVVIASVVAGVFALRKYSTINTKTVVALIAICVLSLISSRQLFRLTSNWPPSDWQVVACDVGQGDATVIRLAGNSAMVVDVGGDSDLLDSCLDDLSIEVVEIFVASHFHADHVGGIAGLSRGRSVNRVVVGAMAVPLGGVELVKSALGREELEVATVGMSATYRGVGGDVSWTVLQASVQPSMDATDGVTINNSSVVLLVQTPEFSVLLTGDIEIDAQLSLMKSSAFLGVDVVKVPHHGSKSQESEFARWTGGRLAWISASSDNSYGHPSKQAITYYKTAGMVILTTADCGDIALIHTRDVGFAPRDECHSV